MPKKFINPDWKKLRNLSATLQRAYFYCWDKADACGVYDFDELYIKADLKANIKFDELKSLPHAKVLSGEKLYFTDYILINYGQLKEGYNPHKPAFRALEKNKISSLYEAWTKLEDEDVYEDKDEKEGECEIGGLGEKVEILTPAHEIMQELNSITGREFNIHTKSNLKSINSRLKDGFSKEDLIDIIQLKNIQWQNNDKMRQYLCPDTLFSNKAHKYLIEVSEARKNPERFKRTINGNNSNSKTSQLESRRNEIIRDSQGG